MHGRRHGDAPRQARRTRQRPAAASGHSRTPIMSFALIAIPVPVRQLFTYRVPPELDATALPGAPVEVLFRGRAVRGVLVERIASTPLENVRDVTRITGAPLLSAHLLE